MKRPKSVDTIDRVVNQIIDLIAIGVLWYLISYTIVKTGVIISEHIRIVLILLFSVCFALYYLLLEYFFNRTIGKILTSTIVIDHMGGKPSFYQILLRTMTRFIPFEYTSFLNSKDGWHDSFSRTSVIKKQINTKSKK